MHTYLEHAELSASEFGGDFTDYIHIHLFMDTPTATYNHELSRSVLYTSFGAVLVAKYFDFKTKNGVSVHDVVIAHIKRDLGFVPNLEDWFRRFDNVLPKEVLHRTPDYKKSKMEDSKRADNAKHIYNETQERKKEKDQMVDNLRKAIDIMIEKRKDKPKPEIYDFTPPGDPWKDLYPDVALPRNWPVIPTHDPVPKFPTRTFEPRMTTGLRGEYAIFPSEIPLNNMV